MMPQLCLHSRKVRVGALFLRCWCLRQRRYYKFLLGEDPFDFVDLMLKEDAKHMYQIEEGLRYSTSSRLNYCNGCASAVFEEDLNKDSCWLNADKFKCKCQMTHPSFWLIVGLIKDHCIFKRGNRKQASVEHQLMMLLCFIGTEGNDMSNKKVGLYSAWEKGQSPCTRTGS
jgi:hypothetical protein